MEDIKIATLASSEVVRAKNAFTNGEFEEKNLSRSRYHVSLKVVRYSEISSPSLSDRDMTAFKSDIVELDFSRSNRALSYLQRLLLFFIDDSCLKRIINSI